jgi:hypothetical protein
MRKLQLPPYEHALAAASVLSRDDQERLVSYLKFQLHQSKPKTKRQPKKPVRAIEQPAIGQIQSGKEYCHEPYR